LAIRARIGYAVYSTADVQDYRAPDPPLPATWTPYWKSFTRALRAIPRSERTIKAYGYGLRDLGRFLEPAPPLESVTREQMESFLASLHGRLQPNGVAIHYRGLRRFLNWLVDEEEIDESPMRRIPPPRVPDEPLEVLEMDEVAELLKACRGRTFEDRRDAALIRLLIDTGVRLGGAISMKVRDLDLDRQRALVTAKGGDIYEVVLGAKLVRDLDRYLRVRAVHPAHQVEALWLGQRGPLTDSGLYQLIRRRAGEANIKLTRAVHIFRHSFSHHFRLNGGDEGDLQVLGGWKSRAMLGRYGKSREVQRARVAHQRYSPGDRV
jgi:site-specific recombinase XerD